MLQSFLFFQDIIHIKFIKKGGDYSCPQISHGKSEGLAVIGKSQIIFGNDKTGFTPVQFAIKGEIIKFHPVQDRMYHYTLTLVREVFMQIGKIAINKRSVFRQTVVVNKGVNYYVTVFTGTICFDR